MAELTEGAAQTREIEKTGGNALLRWAKYRHGDDDDDNKGDGDDENVP